MISDFNQTGQSFSATRERIKNPTLAQSLRQRREFHEAIESERVAHGVMKQSFQGKYKVLKQTDDSGSTIRIRETKQARPETPKVNMLELQRRRTEAMNQVKLGEKRPFNYLNPYKNLAELSKTQVLKTQTQEQLPDQV